MSLSVCVILFSCVWGDWCLMIWNITLWEIWLNKIRCCWKRLTPWRMLQTCWRKLSILRISLALEFLWALIPWTCDIMNTWPIFMKRKQQVGECWVCVIFFACECGAHHLTICFLRNKGFGCCRIPIFCISSDS